MGSPFGSFSGDAIGDAFSQEPAELLGNRAEVTFGGDVDVTYGGDQDVYFGREI